MEKSFLNKISPVKNLNVYCEWYNGKLGAITDTDGLVFRFCETVRNKRGQLERLHENDKDNPIIIVGITAWWIRYRDNKSNRFINEFKKGKVPLLDIRAQFKSYTEMRYEQFKAIHKDNPDTWNWDWDYEFYAKYIIPHEAELNRQSKKLFEFISESEIELVSSVMSNYIKYLKMRRSELGYNVPDELKVLRYSLSRNDLFLEDLEDFEVNTILDELESNGYVKVAWVEGHQYESVRILDKGKVYLKQLEEQAKCKVKDESEKETLTQQPQVSDDIIVKEMAECFWGNKKYAKEFLDQIKAVKKDAEKPAIALQYVKDRKLSGCSMRRSLWTILHKYNLYSRTEDNWNTMLRKSEKDMNTV